MASPRHGNPHSSTVPTAWELVSCNCCSRERVRKHIPGMRMLPCVSCRSTDLKIVALVALDDPDETGDSE